MGHLYVIPARDEPVAVILRRGPKEWYHLILWQTRRDIFTHGAWIKGRIYEDKCDLSPDGELFVYFVFQGSRRGTSFTHAWTAISRPPWLHALVLWPQGTTYGGGGKFTGPRTIRGVSPKRTHPDFPFPEGRLKCAGDPPAGYDERPYAPPTYLSGTDWSGRDQQGFTIFTKGHVLYRRNKEEDIVIADFTNLTPDPQPAPDWATRPL